MPDINYNMSGGDGKSTLNVYDSDGNLIDSMSTPYSYITVPEGTYELEIVADDGYMFDVERTVIKQLSATLDIEYNHDFTIGVAMVTLTDQFATNTVDVDTYTLEYEEPEPEPEPEKDVLGFNYVYRVDKEILRSIAGERFEVYVGDGRAEIIDLGEFILNVLELPFTISDDVLGEEKLVVLGNVTLETYATEILTDKLEVDLGTIDVPATYNNSYDYLNTTVTLHLPYVESIELEPDFVIGETVNVSYTINLYTGETTVNISSSKNEIIISRQVQIGREIPFMKAQSHEMMFSSRGSFGIDNKITTAFIEVSRNVPYKIDNAFDDNVVDYVQLKDVDGYVTVNEIKLESSATFQEKQEIKNILRNGVVIK